MITGKQRAYLRCLGNDLEPIFQIGKGGLSPELINQLEAALEARELIKIRILKNCPRAVDEVVDEIVHSLGCALVQKIGRNFIVYREALEEPRIRLL
ncbi:MAG: YhbY family RNA-binding protein [Firmicutes bacterium]|nr:YhbY family RNA-binding protein [Bacillota bacterium]